MTDARCLRPGMTRAVRFAIAVALLACVTLARADDAGGDGDDPSPPKPPEGTADEKPADTATEEKPKLVADDTFELRIVRAKLELPNLVGFRHVRYEQPRLIEALSRGVPLGQEVLDALLPSAWLDAPRGDPVRMHVIRTKTAAKALTIDDEEFADLRKAIREELAKALEEAAKGREARVGESRLLEVFDETKHSISVLVHTRLRRGRRDVVDVYQALTTCLLKGKVVYLATSSRGGDDDKEWVKKVARAWARKAVEANAPKKSERDGEGDGD